MPTSVLAKRYQLAVRNEIPIGVTGDQLNPRLGTLIEKVKSLQGFQRGTGLRLPSARSPSTNSPWDFATLGERPSEGWSPLGGRGLLRLSQQLAARRSASLNDAYHLARSS
jgi:hypothetical protein